MKNQSKNLGFSLIEMLVAIAIMIVLAGLGIASFIRFNERQQVANTAKQIQHIMRTAQSKARVKEIPSGCSTLFSYEVHRSGSGPINLRANCQTGVNPQLSSWTAPSGMSVSPGSFSVKFKTLHGSAEIKINGVPNNILTTNIKKGTEYDYQFNVTSGGEITSGNFN